MDIIALADDLFKLCFEKEQRDKTTCKKVG